VCLACLFFITPLVVVTCSGTHYAPNPDPPELLSDPQPDTGACSCSICADTAPEMPKLAEIPEEEAEVQVSNRPLLKDASRLPLFRGDEKDAPYIDTFLRSLRPCFRVNAASYAVDSDAVLKISSIGNCFPWDFLARIWFDDVEDSLNSYDDFEVGL
jgi:hypothetical protein